MNRTISNIISLCVVFCLFNTGSAFSFGLGDLTSNSSASESVDTDTLIDEQAAMVSTLVAGLKEYTAGQSQVAKALGLKEESEKLEAQSEAFGSGNISTDELDRAWGISKSGQDAIDKAVDEGVDLSDEAKEEFAKALPLYAKGTIASLKLVPDVEKWGKSATSALKGAGLMDAVKMKKSLDTGLYVATELPGYISTAKDSYTTLIAFSKKNNIDVSKAEDLLGEDF
jgi:hypothetical protein